MPLKAGNEPDESTVPDVKKSPIEECSEQRVQPVTARMAVDDTIFSLTEMFRSFMEYLKEHDNLQDSETVRREQNFKVLNHHITQMQLEIDRIRLGAISDKPVPRVTDQELCLARLKDTDNIYHYLLTFERLAETYQWSKEDWASYLKPFLTGDARSAFDAMDPVHAQDYDSVKTAILKKYEIRAETFRQRFRNPNTPADESPQELYARLKGLFCKWVNYDSGTKKDIMETLVLEQYLQVLNQNVRTWVKERDPATAKEAASLVEAYITACKGTGSFCYAGVLSLTRGFAFPGQSLADKPLQTASLTQTKLTTISEVCAENKVPAAPSTPPSVPLTFSLQAKAASPPSFSPSSGFTFSAPTKKTSLSYSNGEIVPAVEPVKSAASDEKKFEGPYNSTKVLKQGSVLDILKAPGFASPNQMLADKSLQTASLTQSSASAPLSGFGDKLRVPAGSWSCTTCLVQNNWSAKKCVACLEPQPNIETASKLNRKPADATASLSSVFALAGSWDCDTCLVRNKPDVVKCVICDTAKLGTGVTSSTTLPPPAEVSSVFSAAYSASSTTNTTLAGTGLLGFWDKFKKSEGSWDCDVCMVQNKAQHVKCVACQSHKPGFRDKFMKPEGIWDGEEYDDEEYWEDEVCEVQECSEGEECEDQECSKGEECEDQKCSEGEECEDQKFVACQSAKPGAKIESKAPAPNGNPSPFAAPAFGANQSFTPVFGQQPNPAPTFRSAAASTDKGGFQSAFGAGSAAPSTPVASPAIPAVNAPSSGGFNFGQTPAFNIGSSKSFMSTPSTPTSIAGRKIKTALRRRK